MEERVFLSIETYLGIVGKLIRFRKSSQLSNSYNVLELRDSAKEIEVKGQNIIRN